jgi:hypothetical protein
MLSEMRSATTTAPPVAHWSARADVALSTTGRRADTSMGSLQLGHHKLDAFI